MAFVVISTIIPKKTQLSDVLWKEQISAVEDRFASAVLAAPASHVVHLTVFVGFVEDGCADGPHDDAGDEEAEREARVVGGGLFASSIIAR